MLLFYLSPCVPVSHPFTAPAVMPVVKYFWKNGYAHMIGIIAIITAAIFIGCPKRNRLSPPLEYAASF